MKYFVFAVLALVATNAIKLKENELTPKADKEEFFVTINDQSQSNEALSADESSSRIGFSTRLKGAKCYAWPNEKGTRTYWMYGCCIPRRNKAG